MIEREDVEQQESKVSKKGGGHKSRLSGMTTLWHELVPRRDVNVEGDERKGSVDVAAL